MTLVFEQAVKVLDEHIEILKLNLLFLMAQHKPESMKMNQKIITIKRELDKAVQERMKLNQIYFGHKNTTTIAAAVTATST
jgi:lysyl-tRNA synthetase class I